MQLIDKGNTMQRIIRLDLGDISHDGHGQTATVIVEFTGTDVSNEVFQKAVEQNIERTGVDPFSLFSGQRLPDTVEGSFLKDEIWHKITNQGFSHTYLYNLPRTLRYPAFVISDMDSEEVSFAELLLWYSTYGTDIEYKVLEFDNMFYGYPQESVVPYAHGWGYDLFLFDG